MEKAKRVFFVYNDCSPDRKEHRVELTKELMSEWGYKDINHMKRNMMGWIGLNKHFEVEEQ